MFSFHKPKIYRSLHGCCICRAKSSSSRFTDSKKYEPEFEKCFRITEKRSGEICNACVLLVKRWKKLPQGTSRDWHHVVDARAGPGTKSSHKLAKTASSSGHGVGSLSAGGGKNASSSLSSPNRKYSSNSQSTNSGSKPKKQYNGSSHSYSASTNDLLINDDSLGGDSLVSRNRTPETSSDSEESAATDRILDDDDEDDQDEDMDEDADGNFLGRSSKLVSSKNQRTSNQKNEEGKLRAKNGEVDKSNGDLNKDSGKYSKGRKSYFLNLKGSDGSVGNLHNQEERMHAKSRSTCSSPVSVNNKNKKSLDSSEDGKASRSINRPSSDQSSREVDVDRRSSSACNNKESSQRRLNRYNSLKSNPRKNYGQNIVSRHYKITSFVDMNFWRKEQVCCGTIFKGPDNELLICPQLLKPCICRKLMQPVKSSIDINDGEETKKPYILSSQIESTDSNIDADSGRGSLISDVGIIRELNSPISLSSMASSSTVSTPSSSFPPSLVPSSPLTTSLKSSSGSAPGSSASSIINGEDDSNASSI